MSSNNIHFGQCVQARDQAAVHRVQIHVGNHFKKQSQETWGTLLFMGLSLGVYLEGFDRRKCVCQSEHIKR